jgi:hypothetical protein
MNGFGMLLGHLVGDYIAQNDWMAANKVNPHPGPEPHPHTIWLTATAPARPYPGPWAVAADPADREGFREALEERNRKISEWECGEALRVAAAVTAVKEDGAVGLDGPELTEQRAWWAKRTAWYRGHLACTVHCLCYTLAVWAFSFRWMPWWGLLACFLIHWPVDRFRLARLWMVHASGQKAFATGPLAPWSVIVVDNVFHLLTLYAIWLLSGINS